MKPLAVVNDYDALMRVLKARREALGLSKLAVDDKAGLPDGYCGKLEAALTNPKARNARSIGRQSLPLLLGALGVRLAVVEATAEAGG